MLDWLQQSWVILAAVIGGITLVWNFCSKTLKEIRQSANEPLASLEKKIDAIDIKLQNMAIDKDKTNKALLTMQRNSLLRSCKDFIGKGYATIEERETINSQYQSYHELGGDSFITSLVDKVMELPIEADNISNGTQKKSTYTKKVTS